MSHEISPVSVTIWTLGSGDPVPRHRPSSRRACDPEGREVSPMTIRIARENGARGLLVLYRCGHEAGVPVSGLRDSSFVPDVALRLRCTACGGGAGGIEIWPDFTGRQLSGTTGT